MTSCATIAARKQRVWRSSQSRIQRQIESMMRSRHRDRPCFCRARRVRKRQLPASAPKLPPRLDCNDTERVGRSANRSPARRSAIGPRGGSTNRRRALRVRRASVVKHDRAAPGSLALIPVRRRGLTDRRQIMGRSGAHPSTSGSGRLRLAKCRETLRADIQAQTAHSVLTTLDPAMPL